jgi:transposase
MISLSGNRIWLYRPAVDMRKQFDALVALVQSQMAVNAAGGDYFVFINRRRTHIKVLYYREGGYCLWYKRLEQGHFHQVQGESDKCPLSEAQLHCLIGGINWQKAVKNRRFSGDIRV